jgi:site-specific DNA-methyltransferase (adenine-specific)
MSDIMSKLYNSDCLEVMDKLINEGVKVDAIITDPPYGTTACKWDSVIPFDEMWLRLKQIRNDRTPIVLFGSEPFSSYLRMSNIKEFKYDWIWDKKRHSNPFIAKKQPLNNYEIITLFYKKQCLYNYQRYKLHTKEQLSNKGIGKNHETGTKGKSQITNSGRKNKDGYGYPRRLLTCIPVFNNLSNDQNGLHPTQKPVKLLEYLIKTYTNENDIVLDFTMGSGTTGVACKSLNRNFIGIEKDEKYFKIAQERMKGADSIFSIKEV